jgi:hypothetical protein
VESVSVCVLICMIDLISMLSGMLATHVLSPTPALGSYRRHLTSRSDVGYELLMFGSPGSLLAGCSSGCNRSLSGGIARVKGTVG